MRKTFLPFSSPYLDDDEIAEVADTLRSDWITTGPKVKRLEREFAQSIGTPLFQFLCLPRFLFTLPRTSPRLKVEC
jgi:dTDP-4-amino-4,6-dideoxygalactose transaminase